MSMLSSWVKRQIKKKGAKVFIMKVLDMIVKATPSKKECPHCTCSNLHDVEILGAYNGALLWECDYCHKFLLRFTRRTTEKHLQKAKDLLIDVSNWEELWEQLPN